MNYYLKRYEKKFFINFNQENKLKFMIKDIFKIDRNTKNRRGYHCISIYFDTLNLDLMNEKTEGLTNRKKIRVRTYLENLSQDPKKWNLEIKLKRNSSVYKKKKEISNDDLMNYLNNRNYNGLLRCFSDTQDQIYIPTFITSYYRQAYESEIFSNCRITIDQQIICNKYSLNFHKRINQERKYSIDPRFKLLELKYNTFLSSYLSSIFRNLSLDQITFSKYVDGAETSLLKDVYK